MQNIGIYCSYQKPDLGQKEKIAQFTTGGQVMDLRPGHILTFMQSYEMHPVSLISHVLYPALRMDAIAWSQKTESHLRSLNLYSAQIF
jgi:hypothetical protein